MQSTASSELLFARRSTIVVDGNVLRCFLLCVISDLTISFLAICTRRSPLALACVGLSAPPAIFAFYCSDCLAGRACARRLARWLPAHFHIPHSVLTNVVVELVSTELP